jgi:molybdopterin synthase sulfur carrier subunit
MGGIKETEVSLADGSTARQVLDQLAAAHPGLREKIFREGEELQGGVGLYVNGRSIRFMDGLDTPVGEGDGLALFPPIGGG